MREKVKSAITLLEEGYTCALVGEGKTLTSKQRGVAPLLAWLNSGENCKNTVAADKVVGKAAAYLYVLLGVAFVYAKVISKAAEEVFLRFEIPYDFEEKVEAIRNRVGDGYCPMERAVWEETDPQRAYELIIQKRKQLQETK